ncbi:hypothetical protein [Nitrosomonas marina]|nr:hypothetical protein [Nitrosomonas marina]
MNNAMFVEFEVKVLKGFLFIGMGGAGGINCFQELSVLTNIK